MKTYEEIEAQALQIAAGQKVSHSKGTIVAYIKEGATTSQTYLNWIDVTGGVKTMPFIWQWDNNNNSIGSSLLAFLSDSILGFANIEKLGLLVELSLSTFELIGLTPNYSNATNGLVQITDSNVTAILPYIADNTAAPNNVYYNGGGEQDIAAKLADYQLGEV